MLELKSFRSLNVKGVPRLLDKNVDFLTLSLEILN